MKRIIYTFTALLVGLAMLTSLFACEPGDYINGGSSGIGGENDSSDNDANVFVTCKEEGRERIDGETDYREDRRDLDRALHIDAVGEE